MSGWTRARDSILQKLVGRTGVRVLVVEGEDDTEFFESLLDKIARGTWPTRWAIGHAGGKQNVLKIVDDQPAWLGIVDRDEWSDHAATAASNDPARLGRLFVLPRFCMESYFIDPDEIWESLPAAQQGSVQGGKPALEAALTAPLAEWVRRGALWHAINPLWDGLRALGFKDALLDQHPAPPDPVIQAKLQEWYAHLDPGGIFAVFQAHLQAANGAARDVQLSKWVHGKKCFREHVARVLGQLFQDQKSADEWMTNLRRTMPVPPDLSFLWTAMQLP